MPLTELQARLLRLLAANRSPDSYLAGATVIHRAAETPRFFQDLDFFHDLEASVAQSAAVNKLLALAGRQEVRDLVDILHLDANGLSVGALAWAACGKYPGYTPDLLLQHCNRHACCTQDQLNRLLLRQPLDVRALKVRWLQALEQARNLAAVLPGDEPGCLYLTAQGAVTTPDPATCASATLHRHAGSVRGAWPTLLM